MSYLRPLYSSRLLPLHPLSTADLPKVPTAPELAKRRQRQSEEAFRASTTLQNSDVESVQAKAIYEKSVELEEPYGILMLARLVKSGNSCVKRETEKAKNLYRQLIAIHKKGGFETHERWIIECAEEELSGLEEKKGPGSIEVQAPAKATSPANIITAHSAASTTSASTSSNSASASASSNSSSSSSTPAKKL